MVKKSCLHVDDFKNDVFAGSFNSYRHLCSVRIFKYWFNWHYAWKPRRHGAVPEEGYYKGGRPRHDSRKCGVFHDSLYSR